MQHTRRHDVATKATYGIENDEGTGLGSTGAAQCQLMTGGTAAVTVSSAQVVNIPTADKLTVAGGVVPQQIEISYIGQTTEAATDRNIFVANRAYQVTAVRCSFGVAAGGASKLQLTKDTGTTAPGAGTDLLTNNTNTGFDLNGVANTVQTGTLTATTADLQLAAGDRLGLDWANTIQSTAGLIVTVSLKPI